MKTYGDYRDIINSYWFSKNYMEWMINGHKYDNEINENFKWILAEAENGKLEYYKDTKKGFLAYIILLDQISRHIYRGTNKAYKNDIIVCSFLKKHMDKHLHKYTAIEKMFILMPLQHSENIDDQKLGIKILTDLIKNTSDESESKLLKEVLFHQKGHYDVIKKFGRFPKRNIFFKDRINTIDENKYINEEKSKVNKPY